MSHGLVCCADLDLILARDRKCNVPGDSGSEGQGTVWPSYAQKALLLSCLKTSFLSHSHDKKRVQVQLGAQSQRATVVMVVISHTDGVL